MKKQKTILHSAILAALALSGCTMMTYTSPTGEHFARNSFGAKTSVSSLSVDATTNGVRRLEFKGYQDDGAQARLLPRVPPRMNCNCLHSVPVNYAKFPLVTPNYTSHLFSHELKFPNL